ncbi:hypothetical protein BABAJAGA_00670 [Brevundimonas phage vB_BgoS-BabaJaga]|nr:hypothetical protein BABAJAGA_00670 [Brevundimonas phage vB_BgoS-BabaJaga]
MARSSGRRDHIVKTKVDTGELSQNGDGTSGPERVNMTAWCGETSRGFKTSYGSYSLPPGWTDYEKAFRPCPKCQSKMLAAKLKEAPIGYRLGERVNGAEENPYGVGNWGYKSVYPVIDTGIMADDEIDKVVGFICVESGWGKLWRIQQWQGQTTAHDKEVREPKIGGVVSYQKKIGDSEKTYPHDASGYSSKEEALMMFSLLSEQGLLKTRSAILTRDRQWVEGMAQKEAERERQREADAAEREQRRLEREDKRAALLADIREALNDATLSNFNRDVMFRVAREAGFSEEELASAPLAVAPAPATAGPLTDEWGEIISGA